jgi:hypothetical protein
MSMDMIAAFAEQMARLRQAIAAADALAASAETLPAATSVGESFASAPEAERLRFLLRASGRRAARSGHPGAAARVGGGRNGPAIGAVSGVRGVAACVCHALSVPQRAGPSAPRRGAANTWRCRAISGSSGRRFWRREAARRVRPHVNETGRQHSI